MNDLAKIKVVGKRYGYVEFKDNIGTFIRVPFNNVTDDEDEPINVDAHIGSFVFFKSVELVSNRLIGTFGLLHQDGIPIGAIMKSRKNKAYIYTSLGIEGIEDKLCLYG